MAIPPTMRAMRLHAVRQPLALDEVPVPRPQPEQVLIQVRACGVCRTDLHIVDGELPTPALPRIPGHQIVGRIIEMGKDVRGFQPSDRVGVPWLGYTDGTCRYCRQDRENLCDHPQFTGYTIDGGFAEYLVADHRYCFALPQGYDDLQAAPLLCAGLIGYRTYRMAGENIERLGIYGFGAAAHIVAQVAVHQGKEVYAFTQEGDERTQAFARSLGAIWAGSSTELPPEPLDAALIFAPVGGLMPQALRAVAKGGVVVSGGIHMSDIPSFPYSILWEERVMRSVANLTRRDGRELLAIAPQIPIRTQVTLFPLIEANHALDAIRTGQIEGATVLTITESR